MSYTYIFQITDDFLDIDEKTNLLNQELAKFFFYGNIAFLQVENPFLKSFIQLLLKFNINYNPPCRNLLATKVLKQIQQKVDGDKMKRLKNLDSNMLIDGWHNKNNNRKYLVFTLNNIKIPQTFLCSIDVTNEIENGEALAVHITLAIELAKDKYASTICAIITDNDAKIKKGVRLAIEGLRTHQRIWQVTCSSHSGNLAIKSLVDPQFESVLKDLLSLFKEPKYEYLIIENGGTKLQNYPDTRFGYFNKTCKSVLNNLDILKYICSKPEYKIKEDMIDFVFSEQLECALKSNINLTDPIWNLINRCQSFDCSAAEATELWLSLSFTTEKSTVILQNRIKSAVLDVAYAANYLHHKYEGKRLNEEQIQKAQNFLEKETSDEEKEELRTYFQNKQDYDTYREGCVDSVSFWSLVGFTLPLLSKFAIKLMTIPSSTAQLEGLFSNWTYIHNKYRNRLGSNTSACLIDIYYFLRHDSKAKGSNFESSLNEISNSM